MDVAFNALVLPAPPVSDPDAPLLDVASHLLSLGYLFEEIRMKGGAYGGGCVHHGTDQVWAFYSYRDPWIKKTLDTFHGMADFIRRADWTQTDIDRAIIGTAKDGLSPIRPEGATGLALRRHTLGETREFQERWHETILRATPVEVKRAVLGLLEKGFPQAGTCTVASRQMLEQASREMSGDKMEIEDVFS